MVWREEERYAMFGEAAIYKNLEFLFYKKKNWVIFVLDFCF